MDTNTDARAVDSCETKLWNGGRERERERERKYRYHSRNYTYVINHAN